MPRVHEIWPGRSRIFCGCCITGPSKEIAGMIYIHVCALMALVPYCVFILSDTWGVTPALPIIFLFIVFCMFLFLYLAACSDPGIIPRKPFLMRDP